MKKLLKAEMRTKLKKQFPKIYDISRETGTNHLLIRYQSLDYLCKIKNKEEVVTPFSVFKIMCIDPNDSKEPYTEETLKKALQEFPALFSNEVSRIKQSPGFVSFVTYNSALTPDELEKDIDHVFNFSIYTIENDPVKKIVGIKTLKSSPILPKMSKRKKDKLF
jgi:hypothetical protein